MNNIPEKNVFDRLTKVVALQTQYPHDLIGLPIANPMLTWQISSERKDAVQVAYEISSFDENENVITSDAVSDSAQVQVQTTGHVSMEREIREFQVRIATQYGWTDFSPIAVYEVGLASGESFLGSGIGDDSNHSDAAPLLRKEFTARGKIVKARLYAASHGLHAIYLNGVAITDEYFTPGWGAYDDRLTYFTYDVSSLVRNGANAIGAELGDGWARGKLGFLALYDNYFAKLSLLAQLEITYEDGSRDTIVTDSSWKTSTGEVRFADLYDGANLDLTKNQAGWATPGFNDSHWNEVQVHNFDKSTLVPRVSNRTVEVGQFVGKLIVDDGRKLFDFGQNISGWVRLVVDGRKGQSVVIRHAEVLEDGQKLHVSALRTAKATDTYVLATDGIQILEPKFTFHGFQFAEVSADVDVVSATGIAVSSASERAGWLRSSDSRLNRFHENVVWSIADNMVTLPTDCPQRDERLGWTGDAQAIALAANTIFKLDSFWRNWLDDLYTDQKRNGAVGSVVPDLLAKQPGPGEDTDWINQDRAGWADAATIVPMANYLTYGSRDGLQRQLDSVRLYVASLHNRRKGEKFLPTEFQYGDWCDPDAPADKPWLAKVSADFVANAFFANTLRIASEMEKLVGDISRSEHYAKLRQELVADIWTEFGAEAITTTSGSAIALEFEIVPKDLADKVAQQLASKVIAEEGKISTGFLGTPLILHALSKHGQLEAAYTMLMRRRVYSWLYQVDCNATTVWERWDAIHEDGSLHTGEMASYEADDSSASMISYNHYAYGAAIDWVYQNVAGIAPMEPHPGYAKFVVAPKPAANFSYAGATLNTPYGTTSIDWRINNTDLLDVTLVVPFGSEAILNLPTTSDSEIWVNGIEMQNGFTLTHGRYELLVTKARVVQFTAVK